MTTVAFIGLGIMGAPMAGHLVNAGFDVIGYNRTQPKIDELVAAGGRGATSIADAVRDADVVAVTLSWSHGMRSRPIPRMRSGTDRATPTQNRRVMSRSSADGPVSAVTMTGSRAMPQMGQTPGPS